ncbi:PHP domain-containing protein [Anaeromicropila populeti]|uniref:Polymerase/histidinol phosphatase N-terminal domain-containing protein n=1 Tax=Anaeromicropila populeti TaxID=37658 RepID=A0A1I6IR62_9FIRM|nr:PHP domain-containing protein [Anaeromicropila populeti]SFR69111.1 hypothetical protein SAMN05661086_01056 [Anaeromicropila populeti]
MKLIDLHVHSNISDGTFPPEDLVKLAVENNLAAFALTDHDTISGIAPAAAFAEKFKKEGTDIQVIPGVELSVGYKNRDIHILGLLINEQNSLLISTLNELQKERENRNLKMIANFNSVDIPITIEDLTQYAEAAVITRAHFAKYLIEHGYVKTSNEAFDRYLKEDGPFYVNRHFISPEDAIDLIRHAGGIPVLAHPMLYNLPPEELDQLTKRLALHGLLGIEAIHSSNTITSENVSRYLASKHHLLITGGSDFHGLNKPDISLGTGKGNLQISYSIYENLLNKKHELFS